MRFYVRKNPFRRLPCSVIMPHFNVMKWNSWEWMRFLHESSAGFTKLPIVCEDDREWSVSQCSKVSKCDYPCFSLNLLSVHRLLIFSASSHSCDRSPQPFDVDCVCRKAPLEDRGGKLITSRCSTLEMWRKRSLKFFHRLFHVKLSRKAFLLSLLARERAGGVGAGMREATCSADKRHVKSSMSIVENC